MAEKELPKFSKRQLADLFGLHANTVRRRLDKVNPCGTDPKNRPLYTLPVAAQCLVDFDNIKNPWEGDEGGEIDPDLLPPDMAKDFWDAELKKQKYRMIEGDLWESETVVSIIAGIFKPLAFGLRGFTDTVTKAAGLTPKQQEAVQKESDLLMAETHKRILEYANDLSGSE